MPEYERLIVPGRFQPPHYGHVHSIRHAMSLSEEVVVVVGSAQESYTVENPLTAGERILLLRKVLARELGEGYCERIYIVPVMDILMHKTWVQYLRMLLPPFDGVVSGNELVLMLFEDMGLAAIRPPMYNRGECSGTHIRRMVLEGGDWTTCIPDYIKADLDKLGFAERIRRLSG